MKVLEELTKQCTQIIDINKECFLAHWVLQNPKEHLSNWTMCCQTGINDDGLIKFWMEEKV